MGGRLFASVKVEDEECERVMARMGNFKRPEGDAVNGEPIPAAVVADPAGERGLIATFSLGGVTCGLGVSARTSSLGCFIGRCGCDPAYLAVAMSAGEAGRSWAETLDRGDGV